MDDHLNTQREQRPLIQADLAKKMVFLVGPRQVGKTWLAQHIAAQPEYRQALYLNYDQTSDRKIIEAQSWHPQTDLLIFDEIHKMPGWKNYLKGVYDTRPATCQILVTGSASIDFLRHSGDSLAGRFFTHHLLPLTPAELQALQAPVDLDRLTVQGGFPEPYLATPLDATRWRTQYIDSVLRYDVFDIDNIQDLRAFQLNFQLLRERVGSPISYASLARDVGVSANTIKKYCMVLEALYVIFRVTPYSRNIARSLLKEPKIYFFDTGLIAPDKPGAQFENLVALSLLKYSYGQKDYLGHATQLHYVRTKEGMEVDFCLAKDGQAQAFIETKLTESMLHAPLIKLCTQQQTPGIQLVRHLRHPQQYQNVQVVAAQSWLGQLTLNQPAL